MDPAMADRSVTIRRIDLGGGVGAGFNGMGRDPSAPASTVAMAD